MRRHFSPVKKELCKRVYALTGYLKKHTHTHSPSPFRSTIVFPLVCHVTNHFMPDPKQNWLSYIPQDVDQTLSVDYIFFSTGVIVGRKGCTCTHVQYSRLDSSGQNLESNGVCSKNETGSTVESTRVTGSLVIRWNRKCKEYFERRVRSRPMESIGSTGSTSIPMESPEV